MKLVFVPFLTWVRLVFVLAGLMLITLAIAVPAVWWYAVPWLTLVLVANCIAVREKRRIARLTASGRLGRLGWAAGAGTSRRG